MAMLLQWVQCTFALLLGQSLPCRFLLAPPSALAVPQLLCLELNTLPAYSKLGLGRPFGLLFAVLPNWSLLDSMSHRL
jgi:hypothetical protein